MRRFLTVVVAVVTMGFYSTRASAWHQRGHMLTALVAYEQLDDATRKQLVEILREHPRFKEDFASAMPEGLDEDDQGKWLFGQASIWPDAVRRPSGDGVIPADPKKKTSYHRANWHFINYPFVLVPANTDPSKKKALEAAAEKDVNLETKAPAAESLDMNVLQAIAFNAGILKDGNRAKADRAVALCWLLHLVGDIHQPLHSSALFTERLFAPKDGPAHGGDHGGNGVKFGSAKSDNLHSLWDEGPGSSSTFKSVAARSEILLENEALKKMGQDALQKEDAEAWAKESFALAKKSAYTKEIQKQLLLAEKQGDTSASDDLIELPEGYRPAVRKLSDERVVEGGFRLAALLKKLV
jgi:hypothetical protein